MKRLWIGVGVLGALLAVGLWTMVLADGRQAQICHRLDAARQAAFDGDWEEVSRQTRQAKELWENSWGVWAALSDHTELEGVDASFARLQVYCRDGHATDFAAECGALAQQVAALGDGHRLNIRNLL